MWCYSREVNLKASPFLCKTWELPCVFVRVFFHTQNSIDCNEKMNWAHGIRKRPCVGTRGLTKAQEGWGGLGGRVCLGLANLVPN